MSSIRAASTERITQRYVLPSRARRIVLLGVVAGLGGAAALAFRPSHQLITLSTGAFFGILAGLSSLWSP